MGIAGDFANPLLDESLLTVAEACRESAKTAGVMARSPDDVHKYREMGFQMVALATDLTILTRSARELSDSARRQTYTRSGRLTHRPHTLTCGFSAVYRDSKAQTVQKTSGVLSPLLTNSK